MSVRTFSYVKIYLIDGKEDTDGEIFSLDEDETWRDAGEVAARVDGSGISYHKIVVRYYVNHKVTRLYEIFRVK